MPQIAERRHREAAFLGQHHGQIRPDKIGSAGDEDAHLFFPGNRLAQTRSSGPSENISHGIDDIVDIVLGQLS